jgi:hypothetical protein
VVLRWIPELPDVIERVMNAMDTPRTACEAG